MSDSKKRYLPVLITIAGMIWLLFDVALRNSVEYKANLEAEMQQLDHTLSPEGVSRVKERTSSTFQWLVIDSGLRDELLMNLLPERYSAAIEVSKINKVDALLYRFVNNVQLVLYQLSMRLHILLEWTFVLIPVTVALLAWGMIAWRIRQYQFGGITAKTIRMINHASLTVFTLLALYIALPVIGGMSLQFMPPALIVLLSMLLSAFVARYQKKP